MARLKVLSALDTAKTQYYHFKAIIIAGMGLFTDAYDLFSIIPIMNMIGRIYYSHRSQFKTPPAVLTAMVATSLLGTAIGQLIFGLLGDRIGRRRVYGLALTFMVLSSFGCGFSICATRSCVLVSLAFFRFLLGIGIGGDYPLSATIMSEFANKRTRGNFIAAVFSMQGFGIFASATVTIVVCSIFKRAAERGTLSESKTPAEADLAWRIILMLGAVPAGMTYYWRMMMPETARYTALVQQNVVRAAMDMQKVMDVSLTQIEEESPLPPASPPYPLLSRQFFRRHGRDLFACSANWFLLDIVFYSNTLFQAQIYIRYLKDPEHVNIYDQIFYMAKLQAILAVCSTIPGYFFSVYFIDRIGRVRIQMMGFFFMALVYLAIGIPYDRYWGKHTDTGFMVLYALAFFFANFGPNTTTFIVPAELFPARFRSTCNGISGAAGKIGAIIGSVGVLWASQRKEKGQDEGYPDGTAMMASLIILAGVCIVGMFVTLFFTRETMARSLEENETDHPHGAVDPQPPFFRP